MNRISILKIYLIFVKIGTILLGGGYVILPILKSELAEKRNLIRENDLIDYFALSQSLPGIVAANISMFTGYKLRGKRGAIAAMLGVITVPFISIAVLASIIESVANNNYVRAIFWGVGISIIALIILTVREMWQNSAKGIYFYGIFALSLLSLLWLNLSPVTVIIVFTTLGVTVKKFIKMREEKE